MRKYKQVNYIFTSDLICAILNLIQDDSELVSRLQKGDVESFDLIYHKYAGKLYSFAFKYLRCSMDSEELVQSVFMKVWENHKGLKKESSFKSYLYTIAYNDICKIFRKRYYHQQFVQEATNQNSAFSSETEESIEFKSVLDRVLKVIEKLPEKHKIVFIMSRVEGKSTREIAEELGLSHGTIDNYVSQSVKIIRNFMRIDIPTILIMISLLSSRI